jgi:glycosylphosphatidylinositol transamidase (GPIT) subunit GPI8
LPFTITILLSAGLYSVTFSQNRDTSYVLLNFSEPMSYDGIYKIDNYSITVDDKVPVTIYRVGVVDGDTAVVLYTNYIDDKNFVKVSVFNLKDRAGNKIGEGEGTSEFVITRKDNLGGK